MLDQQEGPGRLPADLKGQPPAATGGPDTHHRSNSSEVTWMGESQGGRGPTSEHVVGEAGLGNCPRWAWAVAGTTCSGPGGFQAIAETSSPHVNHKTRVFEGLILQSQTLKEGSQGCCPGEGLRGGGKTRQGGSRPGASPSLAVFPKKRP